MSKSRSEQPVVLPTQTGGTLPLARGGYFKYSAQPLHILVFLLPVLIVYELGSTGIIGGGGVGAKLQAQDMLIRFFNLFGEAGLHLPAIALVVVLLVQHLLSKQSWTVRPKVLLAMIAESAFLTGPLIVLGVILQPLVAAMMLEPDAAAASAASLDDTLQGIFLAFGAGLYEEMLFRLVLIALLHFVFCDVLGLRHKAGVILAVVLSSLAFAWHHNEVMMPGGGINWRLATFYTLAGAYFAVLFLARGFGIAVGAHLMYDLLVLVVMPGIQSDA